MATANVAYGSLPFSEQIAFFRRKVNIPTHAWTDLWQEQHDHAFVVAGANRGDLVADFRAAVDKVIAEGGTLEDFRRDFDRIVAKHGWDYNGGRNWRSRVIYDTNLNTSYAAGRYAQLQAVKKTRPYWQYVHSDAVEHPRPLHEAWHGLVLHADDPWWDTNYPPNGWGCQCTVHALNERDLRRLGKSGPDKAPDLGWHDTEVGQRSPSGPQTVRVPAGVDPGFAYAPGRAAFGQLVQQALGKTAALPAAYGARSAAELLARPRMLGALQAGFQELLAAVALDRVERGRRVVVGTLSPTTVAGLTEAGLAPQAAPIFVRDADILHALRDVKAGLQTASGLPKALTLAEYGRAPTMLAQPQAVLLDAAKSTLIFVFPAERREAAKLVVRVDFVAKGLGTVNLLRSASLIDYADLRSQITAGALRLIEGAL